MEYIDQTVGLRSQEEIVSSNEILDSLDMYGYDTSLYDIRLLEEANKDNQKYVLTKDGKIYNGSIKCIQTKQKDKISSNMVCVVVKELPNKEKALQFVYPFNDGTVIDARGMYARTNLKIVRRRMK